MAPNALKDREELPQKERLDLAIQEYNRDLAAFLNGTSESKKKPAIERIALSWGLVPSTLYRRVKGQTQSSHQAHKEEQRLTAVEEEALKSWILQVAEWGWPPTVALVRHMVYEMLVEKGDHRPLGKNWMAKFLNRHEELQSRFSQPLDKERAATHQGETIMRWFELVESVIQKYDIDKDDTYNMDEKGSALGAAGKSRIICSKHDLSAYKAQDGSREWASLIECISATGRLLSMFVIFKGKRHMKSWYDQLEDKDAWIAVSENGWTNNVLGLEWFTKSFEPQTRKTLKGRYRLLIFDGHASHISTKVIVFCCSNDIILLCLPAHSTHILQPLDVGFFQPLSTYYHRHLEEWTRYIGAGNGGGYTMDKTDFIRLIQMARKNAATERNITRAWEKSGLFPIQPQIVLDKLGIKAPEPEQLNPPEVTVTSSTGQAVTVPFTPKNAKQVNEMVQQIKGGNPDPKLPEKLGKACSTALAATTLLQSTNNDLVKAEERKKNKAKRGQGHWGEGQVMNLTIVDERKAKKVNEEHEAFIRGWSHLGPGLFEDTKRGRSPVKKKATIPPTPGPLIPITPLAPLAFRVPPQPEREKSPPLQALSQQRGGGSRGRSSGRGRGGRGGRGGGGGKEVVEKVVEEEVVFSRSGRPIKPKKR